MGAVRLNKQMDETIVKLFFFFRFQESVVEKIREEEKAKFQKEWANREAQLRSDLNNREREISRKLKETEIKIAKQQENLENDIARKRQELSLFEASLRDQHDQISLEKRKMEVRILYNMDSHVKFQHHILLGRSG